MSGYIEAICLITGVTDKGIDKTSFSLFWAYFMIRKSLPFENVKQEKFQKF